MALQSTCDRRAGIRAPGCATANAWLARRGCPRPLLPLLRASGVCSHHRTCCSRPRQSTWRHHPRLECECSSTAGGTTPQATAGRDGSHECSAAAAPRNCCTTRRLTKASGRRPWRAERSNEPSALQRLSYTWAERAAATFDAASVNAIVGSRHGTTRTTPPHRRVLQHTSRHTGRGGRSPIGRAIVQLQLPARGACWPRRAQIQRRCSENATCAHEPDGANNGHVACQHRHHCIQLH